MFLASEKERKKMMTQQQYFDVDHDHVDDDDDVDHDHVDDEENHDDVDDDHDHVDQVPPP